MPGSIELRVQRLAWFQRVARAPWKHRHFLVMMYGKFIFEEIDTTDLHDHPEQAHPWLRQLHEDVKSLAVFDDMYNLLADIDFNPQKLLLDRSLVEIFCDFDVTQLKRIYLTVAIPPVGISGSPLIDTTNHDPDHAYICPEYCPDGSLCGKVFALKES